MPNVAATVGTSDSVPEALVLFQGIEASATTVEAIGFDGIEIATVGADSIDVESVLRVTRRHGLTVAVVSTGQVSRVQGLHLVSRDASERRAAVEELTRIIGVAGKLGADVNISLVRGRVPSGVSRADALDQLHDALSALCRAAAPVGVNLLLEQMNRYETNLLNSIRDVGEFIREASLANLKIHADTYHMNIEDADLRETLRDYSEELGYIHFSDSNRLAPGEGHIDFRMVAATLEEIGYAGWIGVETLREPSGEEAARRALGRIRQIYAELEAEGTAQELRTTSDVSSE